MFGNRPLRTAGLFAATLASLLLLGGCASQPSAPRQSAAHSPCDKLATAKPAPAEVDQRSTPLYHYAICYPRLGAARDRLMPALHGWADKQLSAFMRVADQPRPQPWTYELLIDFRVVAQGEDFISVLAHGYTYTGGAHGLSLLGSFTLAHGRLVEHPDNLFDDPRRARSALSVYARKVFAQRAAGGDTAWCFRDGKWLHQGSAPTAQNYAIATLTTANGRATGLRLYFTPYQVAPYACGIQTINVPADIFAHWLKPDLRALFIEPFT